MLTVNLIRKSQSLLATAAPAIIWACASTPPATVSADDVIVLGADTAPPSPATGTAPATPGAFTLCSETNPSGCSAGPAKPSKLDVNRRYSVTIIADDPIAGHAAAPVTVVVFSDFECPFCSQLETVLTKLRARFGTRVRFVWKDLPLPSHTFAFPAAVLAREAYFKFGNERFWLVHDELFLHQSQLSSAWLSDFAKVQGLTWPPDTRYAPRINQNVHLADKLSITATPTVFINGRPIVGAQNEGAYADLIVEELDRQPVTRESSDIRDRQLPPNTAPRPGST